METTINGITYICYDHLLVPKCVCESLFFHPNGPWYGWDEIASALNKVESVDEFIERYYDPFMRTLRFRTQQMMCNAKDAPLEAIGFVTAYRERHSDDNPAWRKHLHSMLPSEFLKCLDLTGEFFRSLIRPSEPNLVLRRDYENCCEEYRRKLCNMWGVIHKETRWIDERVGWKLSVLYWKDPIPMDWVKWFVENGVTEEEWLAYLDYCSDVINSGKSTPSISFYRWFDDGERPLPVNKDYN